MSLRLYYEHRGITIYHGDCRIILPTLSCDVLLTDPPYGIPLNLNYSAPGRRGTQHGISANKNYPPIFGNEAEFNPEWLMGVAPLVILWGANHYAHKLPHRGRWLIWDKRAQKVPARKQADCEMAWCSEYGAARIFYHLWDGFLKDSERGIQRQHPSQKPVALMEWCLSQFGAGNCTVDPYMGSGTTLVAAQRLGRRAIGIEIEERYCEIAAKRLAQEVLPLEQPA